MYAGNKYFQASGVYASGKAAWFGSAQHCSKSTRVRRKERSISVPKVRLKKLIYNPSAVYILRSSFLSNLPTLVLGICAMLINWSGTW